MNAITPFLLFWSLFSMDTMPPVEPLLGIPGPPMLAMVVDESVGGIPSPLFRVTTYQITGTEFASTTYTLVLNNDLADDYFLMIYPDTDIACETTCDNISQGHVLLKPTADPNGTGDLAASGATNEIDFSRPLSGYNWIGHIIVVECLDGTEADGFNLLSVEETLLTSGEATDTDTSATSWSDVNQVTLISGWMGGGVNVDTPDTGQASRDWEGAMVRVTPSATATLNLDRSRSDSTQRADNQDHITYVVEWGSGWSVERETFTYVMGDADTDDCNSDAEYNTDSIAGGATTRANTWVRFQGYESASGAFPEQLMTVTLGAGITQNSSETVTSHCVFADGTDDDKETTIEILYHPNLAVEYLFGDDGSSSGFLHDDTDLVETITITGAGGSESYDNTGGLQSTEGERFVQVYPEASDASWFPSGLIGARATSDTVATITRGNDENNISIQYQVIDFSGITYTP